MTFIELVDIIFFLGIYSLACTVSGSSIDHRDADLNDRGSVVDYVNVPSQRRRPFALHATGTRPPLSTLVRIQRRHWLACIYYTIKWKRLYELPTATNLCQISQMKDRDIGTYRYILPGTRQWAPELRRRLSWRTSSTTPRKQWDQHGKRHPTVAPHNNRHQRSHFRSQCQYTKMVERCHQPY